MLLDWLALMERRFIPLNQRDLIEAAERIPEARSGKKRVLGRKWLRLWSLTTRRSVEEASVTRGPPWNLVDQYLH
jgi:hypothetical protein